MWRVKCECYLALQKEEHQHADEVPVGAAPPSALRQSFFRLWVVTTEQPDRGRERVEERDRKEERERNELNNRE